MTGAAPPLSIGMPVYNGERWMPRTLESLLGQSFGDFELIISDNASTDRTQELCRDTLARDPRVRYFRQPANIGIYPNYNAVFAPARGRLFKWASSNDICERDFLARCIDVLAKRPDVVLCYTRTRLIDGDGRTLYDLNPDVNLEENNPGRRGEKFVRQMQLYNSFNGVIRAPAIAYAMPMGSYFYADGNLLLSLVLTGKFHEVPEYLFLRRVDKDACVALRVRDANERSESPREHYNPYGGKFPFLSYCVGFLRSVNRASISTTDKLRLYAFLAQRVRWTQQEWLTQMRQDLVASMRSR